MNRLNYAAGIAIFALLLSGCMSGTMPISMSGHVYTHTVEPLTVDLNRTIVAPAGGEGDIKHIALCMASAAWDSAAIGDIAKRNGLNEIYFADLETFSVLRIWNQYTVHVYGK